MKETKFPLSRNSILSHSHNLLYRKLPLLPHRRQASHDLLRPRPAILIKYQSRKLPHHKPFLHRILVIIFHIRPDKLIGSLAIIVVL